MKPFITGLFGLALLAVPASAQMTMGGGKEASPVQKQYEQELKEREEIDRQYRATVRRNIHANETVNNDPWAIVRPVDQGRKPR